MNSPICDLLDIEFPLVAFSHCRDVVVEVSKAGGMGVLGAVGMSPEILEEELTWIDNHIQGHSYGVDFLIPNSMIGRDSQPAPEDVVAMVPPEHKRFADSILEQHHISTEDITDELRLVSTAFGDNMRPEGSRRLADTAFRHPIKLIANALGVPPEWLVELAKGQGVAVAALVGTKEHAIRQIKAGVDVLVVSGTEGGGHCGKVSSMVLVPECWEAVEELRKQGHPNVPILAAGGIATGKQMAGAMTMGAAGAWTGSVWLTTTEAETSETVKDKMVAASSSQTVRSRSRTGKHSRQLRSPWTDAWEAPESPDPLPMPLQTLVSEPALSKVRKLAEGGHDGAQELDTYFVGQGVGLMNSQQTTRNVVYSFKEDFVKAYARLAAYLGE